MSSTSAFLKGLKKIVFEDLRVIFTFLFVILFLGSVFAIFMGFMSNFGATVSTPSYRPYNERGDLIDTDGDSLPDVIEAGTGQTECVRGDTIRIDGDFIGYCTGTNPNRMDTDGDLFTDNMEDSLGTNPLSFWNPGLIFIIASIYVIGFASFFIYKEDPLKEYHEFEETAVSSGVSSKSGKFAYSGSSVFGDKKASDVSEEERRKAIQQDQRFQSMTGESSKPKPKVKKSRNWGALAIQFSIAVLLGVWILVVIRST